MGQKRIQEKVSRKLPECGAQLCGLIHEKPVKQQGRLCKGFERTIKRPTAYQEQEEACSYRK